MDRGKIQTDEANSFDARDWTVEIKNFFSFLLLSFLSFLFTGTDLKTCSPFSIEVFGYCCPYSTALLSVAIIAPFLHYTIYYHCFSSILFFIVLAPSYSFVGYSFIFLAMDRSNGYVSRQGSISHMSWPSETSAFTSHLRQCSAETAMERQLGFDRSHPSLSSYLLQLSGQDGRDAIREQQQQMAYPNQQQMNNIMMMGAAATPASRGLASSNWRTIGQDGNTFTRAHPRAQPSSGFAMAAMEQGDARGAAAGSGLVSSAGFVSDGYAYYLNRGDGQVTRLIPADVLPSLNEIPPRELEQRGMIVLPLPRGIQPGGTADMNFAVTVKVSKFLCVIRRKKSSFQT